MNKPIHKVLEDYELLTVTPIQTTHSINMTSAVLWRMNLCAVSDDIPCTFFVAMNYRINVYTLDTIHSPFKPPKQSLRSPSWTPTGGGLESPFVINSIKIGRMLDKEILVSVAENGEVCIWRTENLNEPPIIINNNSSTWGIAIHANQGLLAVSANNFNISIYNMVELTKENPIYGQPKRDYKNLMGSETMIELCGHVNNIPNIDFNDNGRYIASASIDQTCKVWDITTRKVVTQSKSVASSYRREEDSYCWSVKFIKPGHFKYTTCIDKATSSAYLQRVSQGRSTSLLNLALSHSASNLTFPMNVSNVEYLMEEEGESQMDFSIFEQYYESDSVLDDHLLQDEDDFMDELYERQRNEENDSYFHGRIEDNNVMSGSGSYVESPSIPNDTVYNSSEGIRVRPLLDLHTLQNLIARAGLQDELESEETNAIERELNGEADELLTEQTFSRRQSDDSEETTSTGDDSREYTETPSLNQWRFQEMYPTQADWALTIVDDHTAENRDGWGDEIITSPNTTEQESNVTVLDSYIRASSNSPDIIEGENVPTFISSPNGSINWNEEEQPTSNSRPSYCIPNAISRSTSSIHQEKQNNTKTDSKSKDTTGRHLGEYLMTSTGKDVIMQSTSQPKMSRIRAEHNMITKVDVRSDHMLSILDRICIVEWLPELELFIAASQKGTVALMRVLQVEFEDGEQACIFNNECYLPTAVLQATPLYGLTVKKVTSERFTPVSYQIFLFYYSGNVLGYTITRKDSDFIVESLIV